MSVSLSKIYPEAHLEVLSSPNVHALIVGANFVEIILINSE